MRNKWSWFRLLLAGALVTAPALLRASASTKPLEQQVRHELIMLPYYSVFDNLSFRVDGNKVTLSGQVTRPTLESAAGRVVEHIAGVASVDNQIQVLPLSPFDDHIRWAVFRAIYGNRRCCATAWGRPLPFASW